MPKIFSIIVTYNGLRWIEKCLRHLLESHVQSDVVIIDNASTDTTLEVLRAYEDRIHLIRNPANLGFGQANNLGIDYAMRKGAQCIFLLNQDAYVFADTLGLLAEGLKKNPGYGILSPVQLDTSGKSAEPLFRNFLSRSYSPATIDEMLSDDHPYPDQTPFPLRFVNAAAWMISRECINRTGLFHPVFFHYGEDNHYASRVQYHGLKIGVLPAARVIHDCRTEVPDSYSLLIRKMKNNPLYTLLDLRKRMPLAYVLGYVKWKRLAKKLSKYGDADTRSVIAEQKKWFTDKLSLAMEIRKETKNQNSQWEKRKP